MPVRLVLRGLILVSVDRDERNPEKGKITAHLIDGAQSLDHAVHASFERYKGKPEPHDHFEDCMRKHQGHHNHQGEIQVFDGSATSDEAGLVPLAKKQDLDIQIDPANQNYVDAAPSYDKFMPDLRKIAANVELIESPKLNHDYISNTVTINRGVARVRTIGEWDAGSIAIPKEIRVNKKPNSYNGEKVYQPQAVYQPAMVRFLNAGVVGYVATECVVDVEDANSVKVGDHDYSPTGAASRRAAENTVEILITNYAPQQDIALPWTLHYRWMFQAAGFTKAVSLAGKELDDLAAFGRYYEPETWLCESEMFLDGNDQEGYPFPYRTPDMWKVRLGELQYNDPYAAPVEAAMRPEVRELQLSDPWDPIACPMGNLSPGKS